MAQLSFILLLAFAAFTLGENLEENFDQNLDELKQHMDEMSVEERELILRLLTINVLMR